MTIFCAYVHARPETINVSGIFYVGKGTHSRSVNLKRDRNLHHKNIVSKYGIENILVGKLDCSTEQIAFALEIGMIKCLRRMNVNLINRTNGGEGTSGYRHTELQRLNNSKAQKIAQNRPEIRARNSAGKMGKKQSAESNLKRSIALKLVRNTQEYHDRHSAAMTGKKQTSEQVRKRMLSVETPVKCIETGTKFKSATDAARWCVSQNLTDAKHANCGISRAAVGIQKTAFGFHWKRIEPIINEED